MDKREYIKSLLTNISADIEILFVANVVNKTEIKDFRKTKDSIITEYFTEDEYNQMLIAIRQNGYNVNVFFNEDEFIKFILNHSNNATMPKYVVFNLARNGTGLCKKSLIPSFCDVYNLPSTGSNAYITCLGRHKFHYNAILRQNNISAVKSWLYTKQGWLNGIEPPNNMKLIAKPTYESASRGVRDSSIFEYSTDSIRLLNNLYNEFEQDVIVQEFIQGYEVQVPLIIGNDPLVLEPVAITINNSPNLAEKIITYDLAFSEEYSFAAYSSINKTISDKLIDEAIKTAKCLGMENYGRVDFRIDANGNYYITDISTHPYLIGHSAFAFVFKEMELEYKDIFACIIELTYHKQLVF
ncbi:hypothetical protein ACOAOT_05295 [Lacrimispora sp. AGF001]|uniref:hypothetical protein n=1 Tax=Lacrimispora sp. AGF001 TaxID=3401631 RepID=UPI003B439253